MAERERVKRAIEAPVAEASKLLEESRGADVETRLAMRVDGWGRGLAAGLEELAIAVEELRRSASTGDAPAPTPTKRAAPTDDRSEDSQRETAGRTEDELRAEAERSRAATAELREEGAGH